MSPAAAKRLKRELTLWEKDPVSACTCVSVADDEWKGTIRGPNGSPYSGGVFTINILFPANYPFKPPRVNFAEAVFHPHVNPHTGYVCIDYIGWTPNNSVRQVFTDILATLSDPKPDPNHILNEEAARLYDDDNEKFVQKAREWTARFAANRTAPGP